MKKILTSIVGLLITIGMVFAPLSASAVQISVPSAPGTAHNNYSLIATSTTSYKTFQLPAYNAISYGGIDIGQKINNAYADCPSTGCEIDIPAGTYSFTTPIVFGTADKMASLVCPVGGGFFVNSGTVLHYTPATGNAVTFNYGAYVAAGIGMKNCSVVGPPGTGVQGSIATSTYGVILGGTNGAFGVQLDGIHVSGFGTGMEMRSNTSFINTTNSVINENAVNVSEPNVSGGNGENIRFTNDVFADGNNNLFKIPGTRSANYCINIQSSGNVQNQFYGDSFDDCQLYINQFGGTANVTHVTNSHFENPGAVGDGSGGDYAAYDYVSTLSNVPADEYISVGNDYMQDSNGAGAGALGKQDEFIAGGADFISIGDTVDLNNNVTSPMGNFILNSNATSVDTISWTGLTNNGGANGVGGIAVKNIYPLAPYSPNGYGTGLGVSWYVASSSPTKIGNVSIGTSTPNNVAALTVVGTSGTTTLEYGDQYSATSKTCFNVKNTAGGAISFYFVGVTQVIENNRCK